MPPSAPTAASPPPPPPPLPPPQKKHPLEITEVLILVGQFIPFWDINPRVVFNGLDPRFLSRALEPVSSSLVSLYMDAIVFQVACIGQLILPALKLLRLDGDCVGVFEELPQRCPNLETIDVDVLSQLSVGHLVQLFHSGGCPRLVNWTTTTGDEKFARVLRAHRRGIKELEAEVDVVSDEISHGIKHHAATLKKLKLLSTVEQEETQPFLLDILQSCHQLESFEYEDGADEWDMTAYLDTANWKNPGSLKSLAFKSYDLTFGGICLDGPEAAAAVGDADLSILGWRMQTWGATCGRDHSRVFLQAVFKHAQAFEQLKAITLNGIVYKRGL